MQISPDKVVTIHYTLTDDDGDVIDSSAGGEPLPYLAGAGNIIPGLESALEGKCIGDKLEVRIAPADGYGEYHEQMVEQVPRAAFEGIEDIQVGMHFQAQSDQGPVSVVVTEVTEESVTVDGNHPLAGKNLNFAVEVTDIRDATEEELAHGHVHGADGHHH